MNCIDVCYKKVGDVPILCNVYPPDLSVNNSTRRLPAVLYFHGGGLCVGNRVTWFPHWMKARVVAAGIVFISADYRLLTGATVYDIIDDIKDLFAFLGREDTIFETEAGARFGIDTESIAVAGSSGGGKCAYLAALYASPKPKAVLSLYGQGGNYFTPQYLTPKPYLGLNVSDYAEFLHPNHTSLPPLADFVPDKSLRMSLSRLCLQLGTAIDYFTAEHEPSLSERMRSVLSSAGTADPLVLQDAMKEVIPSQHHGVFPQLNITSSWPPTFLYHGATDMLVLPIESRHLKTLLDRAGVPVRLIEVEGKGHAFDYAQDAEVLYGAHFDEITQFLKTALLPE
ncbi:alpha/beta-hydrolase [Roridomyces roridus]|uniref:Alpha/beta-hydrolase n=1 Tax=Roridomyces roridus TaxID=1738132 RepID=A0AAD7CAB0_9AGAR|nr:alpha/beta-hydrolase [Roridomyces roridus]